MYKTCAACGSTKLIPGASVEDGWTSRYAAREHVIRIGANPKAFFSNHITESKVKAYICGTCGYTALFAEQPHELYEAYQQYLSHTT
jgi:hypothetical protein